MVEATILIVKYSLDVPKLVIPGYFEGGLLFLIEKLAISPCSQQFLHYFGMPVGCGQVQRSLQFLILHVDSDVRLGCQECDDGFVIHIRCPMQGRTFFTILTIDID